MIRLRRSRIGTHLGIFLSTALLMMISLSADAQDDNPFLVETMLSEYMEQTDQETLPDAPDGGMDVLRRVNLNDLSPDDLQRMTVLSKDQCTYLLEYLKNYGALYSFHELIAIEGFDSLTIHRLRQVAEIGPVPDPLPLTPGNLVRHGHHDLLIRYREVFPHQSGYITTDSTSMATSKAYLGSPQGLAFRYRYAFTDKVIIGFTGEKDPGEEFFGESQPAGMDFYSGFLSVRHMRWLEQFTAGTFRVSFGQALTLGGNTFGSSVGFGSTYAFSDGFRPTQSACEYGYFQGVCTTVKIGRWTGSGFISYVKRDATITGVDSLSGDLPQYSSLTASGYHRTPLELEKKDQIRELVYGGNIRFRGNRFVIGLSGYLGRWYGLPEPFEEVYQAFSLSGSHLGAIGMDGRLRLGRCQLFGEYSISRNGGQAWLAGLSAIPVSGLDLLVSLRNYRRDYQNPFSTAVSQGSDRQNEQGIYFRLLLQLFSGLEITWYTDLFRRPWVSYQVDAPCEGIETGILTTYTFSPVWSAGFRYYLKRRERNGKAIEPAMPGLVSCTTHDLQVRLQVDPLTWLRLKSSFCYRLSEIEHSGKEPGYLLSQEGRYHNRKGTVSVGIKYMLFDCPYYASRIYAWEPDILYGFSVPASYGRGSRVVLLVSKQIGRHVELWGWGGIWIYDDRSEIGSGLEEITGNLKAEVRLQIRISI